MSETREKGKADKGPFDVSRRIPLAPVAAEKLQDAVRQLTALDPILDACVDRHGRLRISYDTSSVGIRDIEALLDSAGIARARGAGWRMKSAWYRFLDENARANAHSQGGACCNRPPAASGSSRDAGKMG
ncbi:MAG: hypothetical protein ABIK08_00065 [Pseudomonadota bacterium]